MTDKPKRRWYQFSLRTMLIAVAVGASLSFAGTVIYERLQGWPTRIAEIDIRNEAGAAIEYFVVRTSDGVVRVDSRDVLKEISDKWGSGHTWRVPSERPSIGSRISVEWGDAEGRHVAHVKMSSDNWPVRRDGRVFFEIHSGGRVRATHESSQIAAHDP